MKLKLLLEQLTEERVNILEEFVDYCTKELKIQRPTMKLVNSQNFAKKYRTFGQYSPQDNTLKVYVYNRNLADILRTIAHELVHHKQMGKGQLVPGAGETGSPQENEANSLAGVLLRHYGKINPNIYE
jgi:hypothetical protein